MTDIFMNYAHEDRGRIAELVSIFEQQGWSVFWDQRIPAGETWRSYIQKALNDTRCVIVAWSQNSVNSPWVTEEADIAKTRGVIIPVLLDPIGPIGLPLGFGEIQAADLADWRPGLLSPRLDELVKDIRDRLSSAQNFPFPTLGSSNVSLGSPQDNRVLESPVNLGFDGPTINEIPKGWFNSEGYVADVSTKYSVRVVRRDDGVAGSCVVMSRHHADKLEFGSLMQRVQARDLAGKLLKYEGELRAEGIDGWAGLWLRVDGDQPPPLSFDNMSDRPIRGSTPWTRFELSVKLPEETVWLNYGIVMSGSGQLWADNCHILVDISSAD